MVVKTVGEFEITARRNPVPFPDWTFALLQMPRALIAAPLGVAPETVALLVAPAASIQTAKRWAVPLEYFAIHMPFASRVALTGVYVATMLATSPIVHAAGLAARSCWYSPKLNSMLVASAPSSNKSYHHVPLI